MGKTGGGGDTKRSGPRGRRWAEDEAVREGPQMVGGWLGRLDGQKERKRGLAQPARPLGGRGDGGRGGGRSRRGKGRGGWFPCLASRNRYAGGSPAPPTPPTPYVIAAQRPANPPPVHPRFPCRDLPAFSATSSFNFQAITHLYEVSRETRESRCSHARARARALGTASERASGIRRRELHRGSFTEDPCGPS